jgi:hypothetical protein
MSSDEWQMFVLLTFFFFLFLPHPHILTPPQSRGGAGVVRFYNMQDVAGECIFFTFTLSPSPELFITQRIAGAVKG